MAITVTNTTPPEQSSCGVEFNLRDANGEHIEANSGLERGESRTIRYTTPVGTTQYMFDFASPCSNTEMTDTGPASYSPELSPAPAFLQGPATAVGFGTPTGEPNENASQPFGPLLGDQGWSGASDTDNDQDWFYLYSSGRRAIDVAIYNTNVGFAHDCNPALTAFTSRQVGFAQPLWQHVSHVTLRPRTAGTRFYLKVADPCNQSTYQLRVSPPRAVTSSVTGPSLKSDACLSAEFNHLHADARVKRTLSRLKRAHGRAANRKLRRQAAKQRRQLKRARRAAVRRC